MAASYIVLPAYGDVRWGPPVAALVDLPTTDPLYTVRLVTDTGGAYYWTGSAWTSLSYIPVGVVPIAQGGTNSSAALNNNRVMKSSGGAIVEAAAITASRALVSDANGIPVATSVTTTEIGYVSGVTSAIQTQLGTKEPTISAGSTSQYWRGDKSFQTLSVAAITAFTDASAGGSGQVNEVISASVTTPVTTNVGSTGAYGYAASVSVTAGRWLAWGTAQFQENGAVLTGGVQAGISSSTTGAGIVDVETVLLNGLISSTSDAIGTVPAQVISISSTTTYYLNTKFAYSSGTPKHAGKINFLRIG